MNQTSSLRTFIASAIAAILFLIGFALIHSPEGLKYSCGLFGIGLLVFSLLMLDIADIVILDDSVAFIYCFARRTVSIGELSAVEVSVDNRGPIFSLYTSDRNYRISYTKSNLMQIKALLQKCKDSRTTAEVLEARVRAAWRGPSGR